MFTAQSKLKLAKDATPSELELELAKNLFELEMKDEDLQVELREVQIIAARKHVIDEETGKAAIIMFVPVPQLKHVQRIHQHLVRELEKRFSGQHILIVAQRRILPIPRRAPGGVRVFRPRSRALTTVHQAILEDILFPAVIVDRRTRVTIDGKKVRVLLEKQHETLIGYKLKTFSAVYQRLTGQVVSFEFQDA
ncbi:ribosomal protein rps7 [Thecamonas trahens ATCC 50062]|uniref:40S ribosomal protein S7 n=1 Tax=Thecamonas trahens ATCC 50062 TaxID=461836 RepID=A0A0L0DV80_THETB|nr:ribosomal protein rps7 [Thecamonas trahens ATCC 50062]KNC55448.1 ribosomal protein rps7 [Thecamonas trahens ATCC 50062]|eukprot:XP_013752985.1 ribosomal protein rps7 [Thecamonas trahens ATCC 50062]